MLAPAIVADCIHEQWQVETYPDMRAWKALQRIAVFAHMRIDRIPVRVDQEWKIAQEAIEQMYAADDFNPLKPSWYRRQALEMYNRLRPMMAMRLAYAELLSEAA